LQWLQDPTEINWDNLNIVRCEASRYFRNKTREYLKDKFNDFATNSKNKNIRDLYRGINVFKGCYKQRNNSVNDENGDLLADSNNILNTFLKQGNIVVLFPLQLLLPCYHRQQCFSLLSAFYLWDVILKGDVSNLDFFCIVPMILYFYPPAPN
jgi:hypothetical protein